MENKHTTAEKDEPYFIFVNSSIRKKSISSFKYQAENMENIFGV